MKNKSGCGCVCHRVNGLLIALIGIDFLLGYLEVISQRTANLAWPTLLILIGLKSSFARGVCKCCENS